MEKGLINLTISALINQIICKDTFRIESRLHPPSVEIEATNSTYQLTASEAVEAGLTWPKTSAFMSRGCMETFNLLALKLRLLIALIS